MIWYSHLLKKFAQFVVIHTVEGFSIVNEAEVDVFLELSCFFDDPADIGNLISGSSAFSKTSLSIWKFTVHVLLKPGLENFEHYYCIGTWNVRSTNQGKLDVVKQKRTRLNINISGISELKWKGMAEFNSYDHFIYYCRKEPLRRKGVALTVNKSLKYSTWVQHQK